MLYAFIFVIFILIYSNKNLLIFCRFKSYSEGLPQDVLDTVADLLEEFEEKPNGKFF